MKSKTKIVRTLSPSGKKHVPKPKKPGGKSFSKPGNTAGKSKNTPHNKPLRVRPTLHETVLDRGLVKAWIKVVFSLAKLPGGLAAAKENPEPVLIKIIRREMSSIKDLWEIFNLERDLINKRLLGTKQYTVAYLLGFHLPNAARLALLWHNFTGRFPAWKKVFQSSDIFINDIGCGTGALAQSLTSELLANGISPNKIQIGLSDVASGPLEAAEAAVKNLDPLLMVNRYCVPVEKLRVDRFTEESVKSPKKTVKEDAPPREIKSPLFIYTLGYVWNELRKNRHAQKNLETILTNHAKRNERALILVVEPATELQSRDAMELRDKLVDGGLLAVYPCPPTKLCPMIERPKDWCFTEGRWKRPIHAEVLDNALGIDRAWLGASLYAFATPALAREIAGDTKSVLESKKSGVVVGRPQTPASTAGKQEKFEYLLCTFDGLKKITPVEGAATIARGNILTN